ncbi:hypothetical protein [Sphingomonas sp.]|uniref:hypothetical protein n=1 Tax=Sphingomonas sp. TaxID=28214 RepID=UPI003CC682CA
MVKIGDVWDSTTAALAGRAGLLVPVAAGAFTLPLVIRAAIQAYGGGSTGAVVLTGFIALLALPLQLWGVMTVIAVASDPVTTRGEAGRLALARLPAALLVTLIIIAAALLAVIPVGVALAASGFDFQAASAQAGSAAGPAIAPGAALFLLFYALAIVVAGLWIGARLFLVNAVIVNEQRAIGAFGRSFALTRGLVFKLIGVQLILSLVLLIASFAASRVVFLVVRLLLGPAQIGTAAWIGGIADAVITSSFMVVIGVFGARLYVAVTGLAARTGP